MDAACVGAKGLVHRLRCCPGKLCRPCPRTGLIPFYQTTAAAPASPAQLRSIRVCLGCSLSHARVAGASSCRISSNTRRALAPLPRISMAISLAGSTPSSRSSKHGRRGLLLWGWALLALLLASAQAQLASQFLPLGLPATAGGVTARIVFRDSGFVDYWQDRS